MPFAKNTNRHADLHIATDQWGNTTDEYEPTQESSSVTVVAHRDNTQDLQVRLNGKTNRWAVHPGGLVTFDSLLVTKVKIDNGSSNARYQIVFGLDREET